MVAHEFYFTNDKGEVRLIGILPERRKNLERITKKSIMNWGKKILGDKAGIGKIYFIDVNV